VLFVLNFVEIFLCSTQGKMSRIFMGNYYRR